MWIGDDSKGSIVNRNYHHFIVYNNVPTCGPVAIGAAISNHTYSHWHILTYR